MSKIIISAPIDFPIVEPDNWNEWWNVWNKEAVKTEKNKKTHNDLESPWIGFDIYVKPGFEETAKEIYNFKNINRPDLFKSFFDKLEDFPLDIDVIRAASSLNAVIPHKDFVVPEYSIRSMLYDDNPKQTWFYIFDKQLKELKLPKESNTWIYPDHESKHGSFYFKDYKKILLIFYGKLKPGFLEKTLKQSELKYKDYIIYK